MKSPALLLTTALAASAMELPPDTISANQSFAVRNGNQFSSSSLDAYEGRILVLMMMTPWCPFCQSNASAVGDGVLDHFNAASRGALRGRNNHGIEIDSLLLSTEPAAQWDSTNSSFATANGYEKWGLDANIQRQTPRVLLGYYRGGYPNGVNSSNLYDWGNDRRRVVVMNLVRASATHGFREIVINQNAFTASNAAEAQALINSIQPPPVTVSFSQWVGIFPFVAGMSDADDDPDRDGSANLLEFYHGTHPLQEASRPAGPVFSRDGGILKLVYRRAKNIGGFTVQLRASTTLGNWQTLAENTLSIQTVDLGSVEEVVVTLPVTVDPARFYQLAVTIP
ncbi:hypothetical protein OKA05_18320 [Luteolibacter arcticus]|uniref:Thioredoxin domain-containing protein n=1 Tax=Luteolibacter arcticus TaxID=1581411 RepID=A0ABT3GM06_9BACT|nr:hypothetical protein [Luteolibacter arcticus]MCW1924527.1 hypothetical protein [Luteolibacter arcticus]